MSNDPLALCGSCNGNAWSAVDPWKGCRCRGSGLEGGPRALGWLRRRLNAIVELLSLAQPEREDVDCHRADGNCVCPICGATYYDHARDPRERSLHVLCDGWLVKL